MRFTRFILFTIGFLLVAQSGVGQSKYTKEAKAAYQYLNQVRKQSGMVPFSWSPVLERSAHAHAVYLARNKMISHLEQSGKPFFSGVNPGERAAAQGYAVKNVTENHSAGGRNPLESIDGLMGAIYHRFGFLDFSKTEVGIALSEAEEGFNVVYNMGNTRLNHFCRFAIDTNENPFYQGICSRIDKVPAKKIDDLELAAAKENPPLVVWPAENARNITPVFYDEIPDPLPNLPVSGYPVSLQFNPAYFSRVQLERFILFKVVGNQEKEVNPVHILDKRNDPNQKLTDYEYALFPLNRLEWGTQYRVYVRYQDRGRRLEKSWIFQTKTLTYPMFVISGNGNDLILKPNLTYAVYIPPGDQYPFIEKLSVESPYSVRVDIDWEDKNTILLRLSGERCQPVLFFLNGNRTFTINLSGVDNLNPDQQYPRRAVASCF